MCIQLVRRFLLVVSIAEIFTSCRESSSVTEPIDSPPPPSISVTNLSGAIVVGLSAVDFSDTLTYALSFAGDSLYCAIALSGVSSGSLCFEVDDSTGALVQKDSCFATGALSKFYRSPRGPSRLRIICDRFTGNASFVLHVITYVVATPTLLGAWEWVLTGMGPWDYPLTPKSEGYTCQVYFLSDSTFAVFRNDTALICRGEFSSTMFEDWGILSVSKTIFPPFPKSEMGFAFIRLSELYLQRYPLMTDTPMSTLRRRGS